MTQKLGQRDLDFVDVTPALAKKWLAGNVANRDKRPKWVKGLANTMSQGEWITTPEPIVFTDSWTNPATGEVHGETLTAGQHRLEAVVLSGKTIRFLVVRHSDAKELQVMSQGKPWTQADILQATRAIKYPTLVASIVSGFMRHGLGFSDGVESWMVRRVLDRIEPEVMQAVMHKRKMKVTVHRQFMAALLLAILADPVTIPTFVEMVSTGKNIPFGDPAKNLRDYLYEYIMDKKRDLPEIYFHKCCNGIAAKLKGEPWKKTDDSPAGLKYLREKASAKLEPILKDLFGKAPHGFYSPKPARVPQPR